MRHANPRFLWEALILDRNAPYACLWTDRERVALTTRLTARPAARRVLPRLGALGGSALGG